MNDATTLTQAGYVGEDVESVIFRLLQVNIFNFISPFSIFQTKQKKRIVTLMYKELNKV